MFINSESGIQTVTFCYYAMLARFPVLCVLAGSHVDCNLYVGIKQTTIGDEDGRLRKDRHLRVRYELG